jgi:hypothetical protein
VTQEIREIARPYATEAIETLAHLMRSTTSATARLSAANALLDRGYGKPTQTIDMPAPKDVTEMSEAELMAIIRQERADG